MINEVLEDLGYGDWEGDDSTLTCPCGNLIEHDAPSCPDGCSNPLMELGFI